MGDKLLFFVSLRIICEYTLIINLSTFLNINQGLSNLNFHA